MYLAVVDIMIWDLSVCSKQCCGAGFQKTIFESYVFSRAPQAIEQTCFPPGMKIPGSCLVSRCSHPWF